MPRFPLHSSAGTGIARGFSQTIRFVRYGCANRPFYHIVVMPTKEPQRNQPIEQLGSYDPMPNKYNEKLVALNFQRIQHWIGRGADISRPVAVLLGLSGFFPVHPNTYVRAWRSRAAQKKMEMAKTEGNSAETIEAQNG